jgi:hypothetical protein
LSRPQACTAATAYRCTCPDRRGTAHVAKGIPPDLGRPCACRRRSACVHRPSRCSPPWGRCWTTSPSRHGQRRVYLPAQRIADALGAAICGGGPLAAFVRVTYGGPQPATWRVWPSREGEAALRRSYLPDGLIDDPHEHARLPGQHTHGHHQRLHHYAVSIPSAALRSGTGTPDVLAAAVTRLLDQAAT